VRLPADAPVIDGRAFGPSGVGARFQRVTHLLLRVALGRGEQIYHTVLQQLVVARAQERRAPHIFRRRSQHVHGALPGREVARKVFLRVSEVDQVPGEILILGSIPARVFFRQVRAHVAQRELAVVVVCEVGPVLLDMHLVGVQAVQFHTGSRVAVHDVLKERQRARAEIVHLRRAILLHRQHAVQARRGSRDAPMNPYSFSAEIARPRLHTRERLHLYVAFQLDDGGGFHHPVQRSAQRRFAKCEYTDAGVFNIDGTLVVGPLCVPPQLHAEGARRRVAHPFAILHPHARLTCACAISLADFERAQQAQFQSQAVTGREPADGGDALYVFVCVGHQTARLARLPGAVLAEEMVEGQHQRARATGFGPFADLAQARRLRLARQRHLDDAVRIAQRFQLFIGDQNDVLARQIERPLRRKRHEVSAIHVFRSRRQRGGPQQQNPGDLHHIVMV